MVTVMDRALRGIRDVAALASVEVESGDRGMFHPSNGGRRGSARDVEAALKLLDKAPELVRLLREAMLAIEDEVAAAGDEARKHPILRRHAKTAAKIESLLAEFR